MKMCIDISTISVNEYNYFFAPNYHEINIIQVSFDDETDEKLVAVRVDKVVLITTDSPK